MDRRQFVTSTLSGLTGTFAACGTPDDARIQAVVTILPLKYFVERVGGERVRVSVLAGPGQNPATYEPLPRQLLELAQADVLFRTGVPFEEALVPRLAENAPGVQVVDLRDGIELQPMDRFQSIVGMSDEHDQRADDSTAYPGGDDHSGLDPHIWLSPALVRIQAATIRDTLIAIDPAHEKVYRDRHTAFDTDLFGLSDQIRAALSKLETPAMLVFHPAWGYFAREFGLRQIPIEIEGKEPGPRELATIIDYAKQQHIRVVFVQSQYAADTTRAIAEAIGGTVATLDPLSDNYLSNLRDVASAIALALGGETP